VYHGVAFVLYLIASVLALIHSTGSNRNRNDNLYLTAAVSVTSDPARLLARFAADTSWRTRDPARSFLLKIP
jgi:hypothetical protein